MLISKNCKKDNDEKRRDMIWENNYRVECMYGKKRTEKQMRFLWRKLDAQFFKGVSRFLLSTEECSECAVAATSWIVVPEKQ